MKRVKPRRIQIPKCSIIRHVGPAAIKVMALHEIRIFNAFCHFMSMDEVAERLGHNFDFVDTTLKSALRKLAYLYNLPSLDEFMKGNLTEKQFLDAPIRFHQFNTRLYHTLAGKIKLHIFQYLQFRENPILSIPLLSI